MPDVVSWVLCRRDESRYAKAAAPPHDHYGKDMPINPDELSGSGGGVWV